jgi:iron(III) transport system substrate-binding protein
VLAYNTGKVQPADLPRSVTELSEAKWRNRVGWVPTNGSFQAFVTGFRVQRGDAAARTWLRGVDGNGAKDYPNNLAAVQAVSSGEVDVALVNHYYLYQLRQQRGTVPVQNHFFPGGDAGSMINVAGAAVLSSSGKKELANRFIEYLLSQPSQQYFAQQTYEYPLRRDSTAQLPQDLPPITRIEAPNIDLSRLADLAGTLTMLRETGALP